MFNTLRDIGEKISNSRSFYASGKVPEARRRIVEFETLLQKEKAEFEVTLHSLSLIDENVCDYFG